MKCYLTCKRFMQEIAQERNGLVTAQTLSLVFLSSSRFCISSSAVCVWCSLSFPSLSCCCSSILVLSVKRVFFCLHVFFSLSPASDWLSSPKILARKTGNILETPDLRQFPKDKNNLLPLFKEFFLQKGFRLDLHHRLHHCHHHHLRQQLQHQSLLRWVCPAFQARVSVSRLSLVCESVLSLMPLNFVCLPLDFYVSYNFYLFFLVPFFLRLFLIYISCSHLHRVVQEESPLQSQWSWERYEKERVKREREREEREKNLTSRQVFSMLVVMKSEKREKMGWLVAASLYFIPSVKRILWWKRRRWNFVLLPLLFYSS